MKYKQIIVDAWQFTQENRNLVIWYSAVPAFFSTLYGVLYLCYQYFAFTGSRLFEHWDRSFAYYLIRFILEFLNLNRGMIIPLIIFLIIALIGYFILPVILEGGLIQLMARKRNGQHVLARKGFYFGIAYFLPMFEYRLFVQTFSIMSIFSLLSTSLRNFGWDILPSILPPFIFGFIAIVVLSLFFIYTPFFIVIDEEDAFKAISSSFHLVVRNLEETLLLSLLMIVISLRIVFQLIFVFMIPAIVVGVVYSFTLANMPDVGIWVGGILGMIALIFASYFNGIIHTFALAVWNFTFLELTTEATVHAREKN